MSVVLPEGKQDICVAVLELKENTSLLHAPIVVANLNHDFFENPLC